MEKIIAIVREAAGLMVRSGFEIHTKGSVENLVTSSDLAVQHFLTERLGKLIPGSGFLCEEEDLSDTRHSDIWIIDPIDGTANYARSNENCCISVALVHEGEPVAGVVYSPWRDELYAAEKGRGATCNGQPIHVSARSFEEGLIFTALCTYHKEFAGYCRDIMYDLYMHGNDIRRIGSSALELCLTAAGQAELYFEMRLLPWDFAAASLILQEAGGTICGMDGQFPSLMEPSPIIAANTPENCARISAAVHRHMAKLPY